MNQNNFNNTNKIFIISAGRTGTKLFGDYLDKIIPDSLSLHEPDTINLLNFKSLLKKIKRQSISELLILKSLGYLGSRNISLKYLNNNCINMKGKIPSILINQF